MSGNAGPITSQPDAALNAALWLQSIGCVSAKVAVDPRASGADVVSPRIHADVFHAAQPTGEEELQRLVSATARYPEKRVLCFANTGFTPRAVAFAAVADVALFTYETSGAIDAYNRRAGMFVATKERSQREVDRLAQEWEATRTVHPSYVRPEGKAPRRRPRHRTPVTTHRKRRRSLNPRLWLAVAVYCAMLMLLSLLAYSQPMETHIAIDQDPMRYPFQIMLFGLMMIACLARWHRKKRLAVAPANVAGLERLWSR